MAGGQWLPFCVYRPDLPTEYRDQYERASRFAYRYLQEMNRGRYGITWLENYMLGMRPLPSYEEIAKDDPIYDLYKDFRLLEPYEHPFDAPYALRFTTMLIEPPIFLNEVMRDFRLSGGKVVVREISDVKEVLALRERTIVNCTGLGAKALFGDEELMPIKGQLSFLLPQPKVDYIMLRPGFFLSMIPRLDGILLGGTYKRGGWSLEPDPEETERIAEGHRKFFTGMV